MYTGPHIITDGLVVYVDATNTKSYPGTGTTFIDLSPNKKNGTISGPTYGSQNGGVFNFDGVNDIISFGTGNTFFPLNSFTIDLWFQSKGTVPTTGTTPGLFGFTYGIRHNFEVGGRMNFIVNSGSSTAFNLPTTDGINYRDNGNWYHLSCQATPTNTYMYVNGILNVSRSATWLGTTAWPTNTWNLGRDNNNSFQFFTGSVANYKMYNRALSADEVLQNYNATKSRFNL